MKYLKITHKQRNFILIQAFFLLCSIAMICIIFFAKHLVTYDGLYHIQEVKELVYDLSHHIWPSFTRLYGISGSAIPTFYPWLAFIPLIISSFFHLTMKYALIIYSLFIFELMFNVLFYCAKHHWHNTKTACLFSIIIVITSEHLIEIDNDDYANLLAVPFIVIAIFSWIKWIKQNKWTGLSISISILIYLHFISAYETILVLIILTILSINKLNKQKIINGIKASITTLCVTSAIWLPLLILKVTNNLYFPTGPTTFIKDNEAHNLSFQVFPYFIAFIFVFIIIKFHKQLTCLDRKFCIIACLFCLPMIMPLNIMAYSPFIPIQYVYKLFNMATILMAIVITPFIKSIYSTHKHLASQIFIIIMLILQFISVAIYTDTLNTAIIHIAQPQAPSYKECKIKAPAIASIMRTNFNNTTNVNSKNTFINQFYLNEFVPTQNVFCWKNQLKQLNINTAKEADDLSYYPTHALTYNMIKQHMKCIPNGIKIANDKTRHNVRIPIMIYHSQTYQFYLNHNKLSHIQYHFHEPMLKTLPKGNYTFTYRTPTMPYRYISAIISLVSTIWLYLLYEKQRKYYK